MELWSQTDVDGEEVKEEEEEEAPEGEGRVHLKESNALFV